MTLQIAMVATDGIVLGSDLKNRIMPPEGVSTSSLISKIFCDESRGIVAAWSGQTPSRECAKRIIVDLSDLEILDDRCLERAANEAYEQESAKPGMPHLEGEVIVVRATDIHNIRCVHVQNKSVCETISNKVVTGHSTIAAVYFTERFHQMAPMERLIPLIAHTILEAGRMNPYGIEDLEIVTCSQGRVRHLEKEKIANLKAVSKELQGEIEKYISPLGADYTR